MAHAHDHHHDHDPGSYFVEQICTIGICGAIGGIAIMLYVRGILDLMMIPVYHIPVVIGGALLLAVVVLRAIAVWREAGTLKHAHTHVHGEECDHGHGHGEACDHDHGHGHGHAHDHGIQARPGVPLPVHDHVHDHDEEHGHSHGHGHAHDHDHSWAPWRYVVLLLPVVLYFLGLPSEGFGLTGAEKVAEVNLEGSLTADKNEQVNAGFLELDKAALLPELREYYEGKTVVLEGIFVPHSNERMFGLQRYKMNCCAADAIPLSAVIMLDPKSEAKIPPGLQGQWVRVQGLIQFRPRLDRQGGYATVIVLRPSEEQPLSKVLQKLDKPPANPFIF